MNTTKQKKDYKTPTMQILNMNTKTPILVCSDTTDGFGNNCDDGTDATETTSGKRARFILQ